MQNLDALDLRLLSEVQQDSSLSAAELAEKVGISQSPCWRRLQRLKDEGYIRSQVAVLDRKRIGLNAQIFAQVKLSAHGRIHLSDFSKAVQAFPEVLECYVLMGPFDFMLRIVTENVEAYERLFFERLSKLPGIQEINSSVALSEIKFSTALPLNHLRMAETSNRKRPSRSRAD